MYDGTLATFLNICRVQQSYIGHQRVCLFFLKNPFIKVKSAYISKLSVVHIYVHKLPFNVIFIPFIRKIMTLITGITFTEQ